MRLIPVYRDVLLSLEEAVRQGSPLPTVFEALAATPHRPYFDGLVETYGPAFFGPDGLAGLLGKVGPALRQALRPAAGFGMEERATAIAGRIQPLLPRPLPDLYLATLFFVAPAATLSVGGRPAMAIGMERFTPSSPPRTGGERLWYHPDDLAEMLPHEAAHAVRMEALGLPPTPRRLSLLEMVMLEGTALLFTDLLLDRESLSSFMPPGQLAWHRAHDAEVVSAVAREFTATGMTAFTRYFAANSPVSGYYAGYSLCRRYIDRFGPGAMPELLILPSAEILRRLG